ncbi:MAG: 50S ribosomal protein L3 [Candidatus Amesbacteria bacterium GW2011_GWA2_47_11b]|uniref:Large ribosomal subunit protein uL3 n=3 Tax=Candidatus Amesiibacteriota TaxID=1752730 RepID=A0A0G1VIQ8_9BACT|nr:MAG: 50S ribosomal protein L3 [Microgenomates group bacterium GW2011_GWC1_46_20]KKU57664.1 MAG: 50S ribosomal protein L3 [Candidatus Amesbacteria bacterium GW2011_GWA2_47_11b]KKU69955.1 MAG: 50S ribosomal protein L3 [Candidatus Amesbacteria bacterium GW2011_GWA1_47_20]KKU84061.1 MAG: 50S ribosomal protein L3 [Candidatus Amesbacteria bacterium GW2011_GWC2_47_8]
MKYTPEGKQVGVTVLSILPTSESGSRTKEKHGYEARQVKIQMSKFKSILKEVRNAQEADFLVGDVVRVTGVSKGKGFAGVVKRHGFAGGPRTHGQSDRERAPGSIGQTTTPGRVYRGKRMAGRMGGEKVTTRGLKILEINEKEMAIIGAAPGHRGSLVTVTKV